MKLWNLLTFAIASFTATIATLIAYTSTYGCCIIFIEEPETPKSLIK